MMLLSFAHFFVDAGCAATLYSLSEPTLGTLILLYNTMAFSGQALWGLAADRFRRQKYGTAVSCFMIAVGAFLPLPPLLRTALLGLGNCGFHVGGGTRVLRERGKRAAMLGVFVAPGSVGLVLGILWPGLRTWLALGLLFCGVLILLDQEVERTVGEFAPATASGKRLWVPLALLLTVAVRSYGGFAVATPWKTTVFSTVLSALAVFGGKIAGGLLADRLGVRRLTMLSLPAAAVLLGFFSQWMAPSLLGQFLLNLTMPVTLWLLYQAMPEAPGLSFGLAAAALWPGAMAAKLLNVAGSAGNWTIFVTFGAGTAAVYAAWYALLRFQRKNAQTEAKQTVSMR